MANKLLFLLLLSGILACQAAGIPREEGAGMSKGGSMLEDGRGREAGDPAAGAAGSLPADAGPTVRQTVILPPGTPPERDSLVAEPVFGGQVYVYEAGPEDRQSVVLVHGLGDNAARDWALLIPELVHDYHVVAFDLPGFGHSSRQNVLYSPENYVKFLKWATDRFTTGRFVLIGHSLGGAICLRYAATHGQDLEKLILVDVAGILHRTVLGRHAMRLGRDSSGIWLRLSDALNDLTAKTLDVVERVQVPVEKILASERLRQDLLAGRPGTIASLALIDEDFGPVIEQVRTPTHIFWGEQDSVTPLRTGRLLAARLADADLRVIPGAAHVPMTQQPQAFNEALTEALRFPPRQPAPLLGDPGQNASPRQGLCYKENDVLFQGAYDHIRIVDCKNVQLTDVSSKSISIAGSEVNIVNSAINGAAAGLEVDRSEVEATALSVEADVALTANHSRLDLAGVSLTGRRAVALSSSRSSILFSVSHIRGPARDSHVHGIYRISATSPL